MATHWADCGALLVGHGSSHGNNGRQATLALAEALRRRDTFAEIASCFWKEAPAPSLDLVATPTLFVVPHFAGRGMFTGRLIPDRLRLRDGTRVTRIGGRIILYCDPLGAHPAIPDLLRRRALSVCIEHGLEPRAVALLIVGHGSSRAGGGASETPEAVAKAVRGLEVFAEVRTAYLEQAPLVSDWPALVNAAHVIVAPLLVSEGMHAGLDLPPLFDLTTPVGGPVRSHGRTIWLMGGLGGDDELAGMVLDLARQAAGEARLEAPELAGALPS